MPKILFVQPDGQTVEVEGRAGESVMQAALANQVHGILAECGGSLACATCHVYVDEVWLESLPPISSSENDMLDATAAGRRGNSRLSCQLAITEGMDGLKLTIPEAQI